MKSFAGKSSLIGFIAFSVLSIPAFSAAPHMYASVSVGASYANVGNRSSQIVYSSGVPIIDDYPVRARNMSSSLLSLNGGYEWTSHDRMPAIALGLGVYNTPVGYDFNGNVIETVTGTPPDTLYNYTYNISNTRVLAEAQFTWLIGRILPFINLGVGPSWNSTGGYTEMPLSNNGFAAQPPFQSQSNFNLAFQAGIGVGIGFNFANPASDFLQDRVSIGYRYVNMGQTSFGTRGPTYPYALKTGTFTSNDIYLSFTHIF